MKRIMFVHHVSTIGGGSYCLLNILKEIDKKDFDPLVLLKGDGPLRVEIEKLGIKVLFFSEMSTIPYNESLFKIRSLLQYCNVFRSLSKFRRILIENNVDVIYLNNMMLYPYLKVAKEMGLKSILHVREHWPIGEHTKQLTYAQKYVKEFAEEVIAINDYSASIFPNNAVTIVYDWIDMDSRYAKFSMEQVFGPRYRQYNIYLFTGGDIGSAYIKGALPVVKSFTRCLTSKNDRLLILGNANQISNLRGIKKIIRDILHKTGLRRSYALDLYIAINSDDRIKCIPSTYFMSEIYKQSYCNVSYFTIPHANLVLAESIIMGLPTIAAVTEESLEYSLNGELALLYNMNDMAEFEKCLKQFPTIRNSLCMSIRNNNLYVKRMFSKEYNVDKLNKVINRILSNLTQGN